MVLFFGKVSISEVRICVFLGYIIVSVFYLVRGFVLDVGVS